MSVSHDRLCWKDKCYSLADDNIPVEITWRVVRQVIRVYGIENQGLIVALYDKVSVEEPWFAARTRNPRVVYAIVDEGPVIMKISPRKAIIYEAEEAVALARKLFGRAFYELVPYWLCYFEDQPGLETEVLTDYIEPPRRPDEIMSASLRYVEILRRHGRVGEWLRGKMIYIPTSEDEDVWRLALAGLLQAVEYPFAIGWTPESIAKQHPQLFRQLAKEAGVIPVTDLVKKVREMKPMKLEEFKERYGVGERELGYLVWRGYICVHRGKVYPVNL